MPSAQYNESRLPLYVSNAVVMSTIGICDSLAIAIGTSHGAYKRKRDDEELQFDILADIALRLPKFPLVLHGASNIPQKLVTTISIPSDNVAILLL